MEIKWYGHSCFLLTSSRGTRILMDPCSPDTGYALGPIQATPSPAATITMTITTCRPPWKIQ